MNHYEKLKNDYSMKSKDVENNMNSLENIKEEFCEVNVVEINNNDNKKYSIKSKPKTLNSKRYDSITKKYHTYTIEYKKKIIEEVNHI